MIPKEKLKVGSLYKTKSVDSGLIVYRVWLGTGWSMGSQKRGKKSFVFYKSPWAAYEKAMPINKIASSFIPEYVSSVDPIYDSFTTSFKIKPKKTIRYLNRPEQV